MLFMEEEVFSPPPPLGKALLCQTMWSLGGLKGCSPKEPQGEGLTEGELGGAVRSLNVGLQVPCKGIWMSFSCAVFPSMAAGRSHQEP